jgi:monoamine oxidase
MDFGVNRRDFIRQTAFAVTAVATSPLTRLLKPPVNPKKVIVVGAGLAGLSAAYELIQNGHDVVILEARARPGGRVFTLREPFADGLYAEGGAMQVFDNHHWTMKYIKLFNLELDPIKSSSLASIIHIRGNRIVETPGKSIVWPLDLAADEKSLSRRELWVKYAVPLLKDVREAEARGTFPGPLENYDRMTFTEFLRKRGASSAAVALLAIGLPSGLGDGSDNVSALNLLREAVHREDRKQSFTIRGGTDALPKAFATRLGDKIHYGAPVVRIEQDDNAVRVVCLQGGAPQTFTADRLVCAIPFSVLRRIEVSPRFSREKQAAIEQLQYTSVARVYVQTKKRFWVDEGLSGNASTDLPVAAVSERTINQPGSRGILESYTAGQQARRVTGMKDTERLSAALEGMKKVFPSIGEHFEGGASKCWDEDEWSRGAYTWFKPGQMTSLLPHIARAEGRLHFAGEHASTSPGWMQGALEAGNRAAKEINEAT